MTSTTSRRAVIFHGYGATPQDHWFEWLAERLNRIGVSTQIPALPNPAAPHRERWATAAADALGVPDDNTIVIAHSLGCITALRHLASLANPWRVGTLVLVAGFVERLPALPDLDEFVGEGVDLSGMREHIGSLTIVRSDDDPYVPIEHTDRLANLLGTSALIVPGAGHFLATDGFTSLPQVFDAVT
jgi:predicted alpha/beta hydrolase family esterase